MLFAAKRRAPHALLVLVLLAAVALPLGAAETLRGRPPLPVTLRAALLGLAALLAADGVIHLAAGMVGGGAYRRAYRRLAEYFGGQRPAGVLAGSLLAGAGEELLFRGVLLPRALEAGWPAPAAVAAVGGLFGALHWLPGRLPGIFALWAAWQGVVLGALYVAGGSLPACMVAHAAHDAVGFLLLARERAVPVTPAA
jgi:membrane protease YdiL (CAAX protease family)